MSKIITLLILSLLTLSGIGAVAFSSNYLNKLSIGTNEYNMVIIAPSAFEGSAQKLIAHKNTYGIQTYLKTTEEIYATYTGRDPAEQIKYFIKDALETYDIDYVLLFGGRKGQSFDWYVPIRYSYLDDGSRYEFFISDLYFADIYKNNGTEFEDWDANGNGVFGEWKLLTPKDSLDLIPDVIVGRLPCRNVQEAETIVEKIITYETTSYEQPWFRTMVCIAGDSSPEFSDPFPYEGEESCAIASSYMTGFDIKKLYTSTGTLTGSTEVITAINQGCGFLLTRGRGGTDKMRTFLPDGTEIVPIKNSDVKKYTNANMFPIAVLGECNHGKLDVTILNFLKLFQGDPNIYRNFTNDDCILECIAWKITSSKTGGAIATITNTNYCYGSSGDANHNNICDDAELYGGWLNIEFFRQIGQVGKTVLGDAFVGTISQYMNTFPVYKNKIHSKSVQEWILIGDPSLKIGGYP